MNSLRVQRKPEDDITQPRSYLIDHARLESCQQWKAAKAYTGTIIKDLEDQMINCPETCLTTSTYARSSQLETCGHCYFKFPHHYCQYWVYDTYNCTNQCNSGNCNDCAEECNISGVCDSGKCGWCRFDFDGQENCQQDADDYRHGCQMAIAMSLALWASVLWLRYTTLQNLIPSFPWIAPPRPPP